MKRVAAGIAALALLLVFAGCPGMQDTAELEKQVEEQAQKIVELEEQVEMLTAANDSLMALLGEEESGGETGGNTGGSSGGSSGGQSGGTPKKPPRQGR